MVFKSILERFKGNSAVNKIIPRATKREMELIKINKDREEAKEDLITAYKEQAQAHKQNASIYKATINNIIELDDDDVVSNYIPVSKQNPTAGDYTDILNGLIESSDFGIPKMAKAPLKDFLMKNKAIVNSTLGELIDRKGSEIAENLIAGMNKTQVAKK
tara:strand:- start:27 stop:506 length:480 start_codon:yes stop_codon:yes gene_type:complete